MWKKKWISLVLAAALTLQAGGAAWGEESILAGEEVLLSGETTAGEQKKEPAESEAPTADPVNREKTEIPQTEAVESAVPETETLQTETTVPETETLQTETTVPETETLQTEITENAEPETETLQLETTENAEPETELSQPETWMEETEMELLLEEADEDVLLFSADPEGLLEDPEGEELQVITITETIELSDPCIASGNASTSLFRMFRMGQYDGCFGNQLSGSTREFYDSRVSYYVTQRKTGAMILTYDSQNSPYTFAAEIISDGTKNTINKETEEYQAVQEQVLFDLQSSLDAFVYDHPEIFWLRGGSCSYKLKAIGNSNTDGDWVGYVSELTYTPTEAFAGASGMISEFDSAVKATAGSLRSKADLNGNGTVEYQELVMTAHDYLCQRFYYDSKAYQNYESSGDYRIFCAAGGFLDSVGTGVVCEGYAKAFKVLCDQWGIPCVLIGGTVTQNGKTEGHMWNGVCLEENWYLMDVTWDDSNAGMNYNYYLRENITSNRRSSGNFGGAKICHTFVYPELSGAKYCDCTGGFFETTVKPTCVEQGYTVHICSRCSISYQDTYIPIDPNNHAYQETIIAPTCLAEGYTQYICSRCNASFKDYYVPVNPNNHDYQETVTAPTCTEEGYTTHTCSRCSDSYRDSVTGKLGHAYQETVTAPTCTAQGYTTYTCSRCRESYTGDYKEKTAHSYSNGICTRCGIGDSIVNAAVSTIGTQAYGARGLMPEVTVKFGTNVLREGIDYTVTYRNNVNPGTAYATVTGIGNYRGTVSRSFQITKRAVSGLSVSAIADRTYNGKYQKPTVTIRNNGVKLKKNTDYTITYSNNKKIGRAVITVKGKGNYTGSRKIYFSIVPKTPTLSRLKSSAKKKMTVSWKRVSGVSGYQIQYGRNSSFQGAKTVTAGSGSTSKTISKLTGGKVYYARVRSYKKVSGKKYYSGWSKVKKITVKK